MLHTSAYGMGNMAADSLTIINGLDVTEPVLLRVIHPNYQIICAAS